MQFTFMKDSRWIWLLGMLFIDIHLMVLQLEFTPTFKYSIPIFDILLLSLTFYIILKGRGNLLIIPLILSFVPLTILAVILKETLLSEYYFWGHIIKTLIFLTLIKEILKKEPLSIKAQTRLAFVFFLLLLILPNLFYLLCDYTPPTWDPAKHSGNAMRIFNIIFHDLQGLNAGYMAYNFYPNASYWASLPFVLIFGKSNDSLALSIVFFWMPLSFYYTKKIVNEIFKASDLESILISFIYHSNFLYLSLYKQFLIDFQMAALLPVYYYYIWRSAFFNNKKYSIISGLVLGVGFLTKQIFLIYAAPGLLVVGAKLIWNTWKQWKGNLAFYLIRWINLLLHGAAALALIIPWFGGWYYMYNYEVSSHADIARMEGDPDPLSLASLLWYFPGFLYTYTWPIVLLLLFGWYNLLKVKGFKIHKYYAVISILLIFIALTLNLNKDLRYILGIFFFLGFGFFGLAFTHRKVKSYILIISAMVCFGFSVNLVLWKKIPVPGIEFSNYVLPPAPQSSATHDEAKAMVVFEKLYTAQPIPDEQKVLKYQLLKHDATFNFLSLASQRAIQNVTAPPTYDSILHKEIPLVEVYRTDFNIVSAPLIDSNTFYMYGRDAIYPAFYLLAFIQKGDKGILKLAGFNGSIRSSLLFSINKFIGDSLAGHEEISMALDNVHFSIPPAISKVEIGIHTFKSNERWPLIYLNKFTPFFKNNYVYNPFIPYSKNINQFNNWVIPLKQEIRDSFTGKQEQEVN